MTFTPAPPAQNIDVQYFQTRNPGEWKARVKVRDETLIFGPCSMKTLVANVAQLLKSEAAYADAVVHDVGYTISASFAVADPGPGSRTTPQTLIDVGAAEAPAPEPVKVGDRVSWARHTPIHWDEQCPPGTGTITEIRPFAGVPSARVAENGDPNDYPMWFRLSDLTLETPEQEPYVAEAQIGGATVACSKCSGRGIWGDDYHFDGFTCETCNGTGRVPHE